MLDVKFSKTVKHICKDGLTQYDFGQYLYISGLVIQSINLEIHFLHQGDKVALRQFGSVENGSIKVKIPDVFLTESRDIIVYVYDSSVDYGKTIGTIQLRVKPREKPEDYEATESQNVLQEILAIAQSVRDDADNGKFDGKPGAPGADGYSPSILLTETAEGVQITVQNKDSESTVLVKNGKDGLPGESAYKIAVRLGFKGTEQEWVDSMDFRNAEEWQSLSKQVETNTQDIADLKQNGTGGGVKPEDVLALLIKEKASGNPVVVQDSANWQLLDLKAFGQSWQEIKDQNIFDDSTEQDGTYENHNLPVGSELVISKSNASKVYNKCTKLEQGKAYKLTYDYTTVSNSINRNGCITDDNNIIVEQYVKTFEYGKKEISLTPKTTGWLNLCTDKNVTVIEIIEENSGISPTNPVPIKSKTVKEIKITGANLFNPEDIKDSVTNGSTTITNNHDGSFTFSGKFTSKLDLMNKNKVLLRKGTYKAVPNNNNNFCYFLINASGKYITVNIVGGRVFTLEQDTYCDFIISCNGAFKNGETIKPMIYLGEDNKPYEPYKEQRVTLTSPVILRGIPASNNGNVTIDGQQYTSDTIETVENEICVIRRAWETKLLKPLKLSKWGSNFADFSEVIPKTAFYNNKCLCDKFLSSVNVVKKGTVTVHGRNVLVNENGKTLEEMQAIFDEIGTDITFVYILDETEIVAEPLPEADQKAIKALKMYYPNTTIDTGAYTEVEYVTDTKSYIDKLFSENQKSITNTNRQMLERM